MLHNFIGGRWEAARATQAIPVTNPATGEILAEAPLSSGDDVAKAVKAVADALPAWRRTSSSPSAGSRSPHSARSPPW